jgi:ABC-type enterobactin transport system permease subunit
MTIISIAVAIAGTVARIALFFPRVANSVNKRAA